MRKFLGSFVVCCAAAAAFPLVCGAEETPKGDPNSGVVAESKKPAKKLKADSEKDKLPDKSSPEKAGGSNASTPVAADQSLIPQAISPTANPPQGSQAVGAATPVDLNQLKYRISGFDIKYASVEKSAEGKLPKIERLLDVPIELGVVGDIYGSKSAGKKVTVRLKEIQSPKVFTAAAIQTINVALAKAIGSKGISGVFLVPDPKEIDQQQGGDIRAKQDGRLTLLVYVGQVKKVRTIAKGPAYLPENPIDTARYARIAKNSPTQYGDILNKPALQDYLSRINRFTGRRVDAAVSASEEPGGVYLDYLVREDKKWFTYAQISNTGTPESGEWRSRLGGVVRQLARLDDVLSAEISTSDFSKSNAGSLSYELAPIFPDVLTARIYGTYAQFTADQVGFDLLKFTGSTWTTGGALKYTPYIYRGYFLDFLLGAEWRDVKIDNSTALTTGQENFFVPYIGVAVSKDTEWYNTSAMMRVEENVPSLAGTQESQLSNLGRFNTSANFVIGRWELSHSFYLEPLLNREAWLAAKDWQKARLVHELAFSMRGQYAFDNKRLVPQYEEVVGGLYTVRGYPESLAAGDNIVIGTAEYRFHVPRILKPSSLPESTGQVASNSAASVPKNSDTKSGFATRPPSILVKPDWDLILRAFVDAGKVTNNQIIATSETDRTLLGAGVGVELQVSRYFNIRCDWGVALNAVDDPNVVRPVQAGSSRVNVQATVIW